MAKDKSRIILRTDSRKLNAMLAEMKGKIIDDIIERLSYAGELCVKEAREQGDYNDITGNLRSSIGYAVLYKGRRVAGGAFQQVNGRSGDGSEGVSTGQKLLDKLKSMFPDDIVLVVVAGMKYAYYVESIHHKNVLSSAKLKAEQMIHGQFNDYIHLVKME